MCVIRRGCLCGGVCVRVWWCTCALSSHANGHLTSLRSATGEEGTAKRLLFNPLVGTGMCAIWRGCPCGDCVRTCGCVSTVAMRTVTITLTSSRLNLTHTLTCIGQWLSQLRMSWTCVGQQGQPGVTRTRQDVVYVGTTRTHVPVALDGATAVTQK